MESMKNRANNIRRNIIETAHNSGAAHLGGALSCVDALVYLYEKQMKSNTKNSLDANRDRFVLSKGHCALALYATLCEFGFITREELNTFNADDGLYPAHCVQNLEKGIELSSGSLGMGLSFAIGQAIALKKKDIDNKVYVLAGNGEANEGSFWESVMFAGSKNINNVCLILDNNNMQLDGNSNNILPVENWTERFVAFGWEASKADGHDFASLENAFDIKSRSQPLFILLETIKGKGVSFMENNKDWHHRKMTEEEYACAIKELGCELS